MNLNRLIASSIALVALAYVLSSSIFIVDQRKFAVVFSFGQIVRVIEHPGLQFKYPAPFENVRFFDRRILTIDNPEAERFITAEKKNLLVDSYVKWRIVDPRKFFISFKGDERLAQDRLTQLVRSALNEEFTKRTVRELISDQREAVMQGIRKKVADDSSDIGVEIVDVRLKRVDLLAEISDSVYRRMEAERKRVANELRSTGAAESDKIRANAERQRDTILAEAYRDAQKIKGAGDAKATALYAEAFSRDPQFAQFYQSLEAYRSSFKDKKDLVIVEPSGDFFKFLHKK
ncbi:protease modulator HflC [Polynucleobacter sphagniphilus]|jgi:membrane protease subunit HflC|uniref:protease modulator HflC n=1 Tax=Polynucleobacter sphagniphilus TaxID=1743169 RepID=UPI00096BC627|nr:protease modulator HflC [Polynucleobacter sphagniphilus]MDF9788046.1 membrane protease subunit HflC [Polynucleobacter sphagniphilus]MDH6155799.1 membrane protease subunit HflC [Polynucleobacter sphagniphilus]MDH6249939.1 membrane protease subunit HflC [Polynucleobacter sphagniphilus]MDH6299433.1 membrane protease subunit HflC [Polynucleobacter sphagniphilus]MDH6302696.1 membrane protease subunit HflC [Polynucleobacter sphagniphilus]